MNKQVYGLTALLPLKAHSERVPGKNFKILKDKPLVSWILDTLLSVKEIDRIVINTDAIEELESLGITSNERVHIKPRKPELCGDFVSMNKIIEDDIHDYKSTRFLMTHTTNPFLRKDTIVKALVLAEQHNATHDSLFTVNKWQTRFYRENGDPINHDPSELLRTQDLEPYYEENSCMYLFSEQSFSSSQARIGKTPYLLVTDKMESIDIDDADDWQMAESIANSYNTNGENL